jgi:predicted metal-dependent hydrolase
LFFHRNKEKSETIHNITIHYVKKHIKNLYIRIVDKENVLVTAPLSMPDSEIRQWVQKRKDWILKSIAMTADRPVYQYETGEVHQFLGEEITLQLAKGGRNHCEKNGSVITIFLHSSASSPESIYASYCRETLAAQIEPMIRYWAPIMHVSPRSFSIRRVKTRWGSCNIRTRELTFALDLVTKPAACIESVVVHELNHFLDEAHDKRFHQLMAYWLPDYKKREKVLNSLPREFV